MSVLTNVLKNPGAETATLSIESDSAATISRSNVGEGVMPVRGSYFYTQSATSTAESRSRCLDEDRGAAVAGERWYYKFKIRGKSSNTGSRNVSIGMRFYTAAPGATTGSAIGADTWGPTTPVAPGEVVELHVSAVAPATTLSASGLFRREAGGGAAASDVFQIDEITLVKVPDADTVPPYIAGGNGNAYGWNGTTDASTSSYYTPEIVLETSTDPSPRVKVTVTDLYPTTSYITLYRITPSDDLTHTVREAIGLFAAGGFSVTDYEAAPGIELDYRAMQYTEDAGAIGDELGYTPSATTIIVDEQERSWISDPLRPENVIAVEFTDTAGTAPRRPIPGNLLRVNTPDGLRMVALVGDEGLIEGMDMSFYTSTLEEYALVREIIRESNGLLLIRTPPPMMVPRSFYVWMSSAVPTDYNFPAGLEDVSWANNVDERSQTEAPFAIPPVTWQTYVDAFPTWGDMAAEYLTWLDALKSPPTV